MVSVSQKGSDVIIQSVKKRFVFFYTKGNVGIVSVYDVVKWYDSINENNNNGERFILVGENIENKNYLPILPNFQKLKVRLLKLIKL